MLGILLVISFSLPGAEPAPVVSESADLPGPDVESARPLPSGAQTQPAAAKIFLVAADLLEAAGRRVDAGDRLGARRIYREVIELFPDTPESARAGRMLALLLKLVSDDPMVSTTRSKGGSEEPILFSSRTGERIERRWWESVDFIATAAIYGLVPGFLWGTAILGSGPRDSPPSLPMALSGLIYAGAASAFLELREPTRGDLPLVLGSTFYMVSLAGLGIAALNPELDPVPAGIGGLVALGGTPVSLWLADRLDPDPGDTQLIREGMFLGLFGTLLVVGAPDFDLDPGPQAGLGLVGLHAGLGLGWLAAYFLEPSLDRVRSAALMSLAGAGLGAIAGLPRAESSSLGPRLGASLGALGFFVLGYAAFAGQDDVPTAGTFVDEGVEMGTFVPWVGSVDRGGIGSDPVVGVRWVGGRF